MKIIKSNSLLITKLDYSTPGYIMSAVDNFTCRSSRLQTALQTVAQNSGDNRSTTIILGAEEVGVFTVIGFCSYRCSQIKVKETVVPAIQIMSFGIDQKYERSQMDFLIEHMGVKTTCADFWIEYCISRFRYISQYEIYAEAVVLFAESVQRVECFYSDHHFSKFNSNTKVLLGEGETRDSFMFKMLDLRPRTK